MEFDAEFGNTVTGHPMEILTTDMRLLAHTRLLLCLQELQETGEKRSNATHTTETIKTMPGYKYSLTETIDSALVEPSLKDLTLRALSNLGALIQAPIKGVAVS